MLPLTSKAIESPHAEAKKARHRTVCRSATSNGVHARTVSDRRIATDETSFAPGVLYVAERRRTGESMRRVTAELLAVAMHGESFEGSNKTSIFTSDLELK